MLGALEGRLATVAMGQADAGLMHVEKKAVEAIFSRRTVTGAGGAEETAHLRREHSADILIALAGVRP